MPSDAQARLSAAHHDAHHGAYSQALEGFLWFHHHALEHEEGMRGVRHSFALAYWADLARLCLGDPEQRVRASAYLLARAESEASERHLGWCVRNYVETVEQTLSVLHAVGESTEADRVRRLALELTPPPFHQVRAALTTDQSEVGAED